MPTAMTLLSHDEKRSLKRNGFVILHEAMDDDIVDPAREAVWDALPYGPDDHAAQAAADNTLRIWDDIEDPEPFGAVNDWLFERAKELYGADGLQPPGDRITLALKTPTGRQRDGDERPPPHRAHGHIDGYGPHFTNTKNVANYAVLVTAYLDDVEPGGGGFTVWPGSHWYASEYYESNHLESLVGNPTQPGLVLDDDGQWTGDFDQCTDYEDQFDALEVTGKAGTVVIWHQNLMHTGGTNLSPNVRMAAINRFGHEDREERRRDERENPWKYWDGMQDISLTYPAD